MLVLISVFGNVGGVTAYLFFVSSAWLFTAALLFGAGWFNPFALDWPAVRHDIAGWLSWMSRMEGPPELSWETWYEGTAGVQYLQANVMARVWRIMRVSRLLLLAAALIYRLPVPEASSPVLLGVFLALASGCIAAFQVIHCAVAPCFVSGSGGSISGPAVLRFLLILIATAAFLGAAVFTAALSAADASVDASIIATAVLAYGICFYLMSRLLQIASVNPLRDGTRVAWKLCDVCIGATLLSVHTLFAVAMPGGGILHT